MELPLVCHSLSKRFGDHQAADGISFFARKGVVTGLLGPNGAGKTTCMRMILGIIPPDAGRVEILGAPDARAVRRRVGYLPEERGLYMKMRARETLVLFAELRGLAREKANEAADRWLRRLELTERGDHTVESLSKGLAQRIQFACALVHDPEVVILDEPMSGLDPIAADVIQDIITGLAHVEGKTVVLSTHDLSGAERLCQELVMIDHGRVVLTGNTNEVKSRYGKHSAAIYYEGDAAFLKSHPAVKQAAIYGGYADIELHADADIGKLLAECAGRLDVRRWEMIEPTLTEIFRRTIVRSKTSGATERIVPL